MTAQLMEAMHKHDFYHREAKKLNSEILGIVLVTRNIVNAEVNIMLG